MSLVINTNTASLNAQRQILRSSDELDRASLRLSSGKRINHASDDAAGLVISSRMTSQVRGLDQAIRNANDGVSLLQVAEGALNETGNMLQRIRELSVQAASGIYSTGDRGTLNAEVKQLIAQIDLVAKDTQFNGRSILDGQSRNLALQIGADSGQLIKVQIPRVDSKTLGLGSTSGDISGAEIALSGSGGLSSSIPTGAIKINGQALAAIPAATQLKDVIAAINSSINAVEASSSLSLTADDFGSGLLAGSSSLTISGINLDGSSQSYTVTNTSSLAELAQKISAQSHGVVQASVAENGKLIVSSSAMSSLTLVDSTGGTATGMSVGASADPDIAAIVNALQTSWISESEALISNYLGMVGDNVDLTLNLIPIGDAQSDGAAGKVAWVSWQANPGNPGTNLSLNLDMADFTPASLPNGNLVAGLIYSDRVVAHEMVHAVMTRNMDMAGLPGWFKEGTAEFIQGADERLKGDIQAGLLPDQAAFSAAFAAAAVANPAALGYSVGYLAVKMLHQEIINAGGAGISEVFDDLQAGNSLDHALQTVSAAHSMGGLWNSLASFNTHVDTVGYNFMTGAYLAGTVNLQGFGVAELDTGSIAGSDFGLGAKNNAGIIPNISGLAAQNFNLVVPSQYGGGTATATARLTLTAKDGSPISIAKGSAGSDALLQSLGFVETAAQQLIGKPINTSDQALALAVGDLKINGIDIGASLPANGLAGKVAAINAHFGETGVQAQTLARTTYTANATPRTEYVGANVTAVLANDTIGINGAGINITAGDSLETVAAAINNASSALGAKAYVDDSGHLHIFSESPLTFGQTANFFTDIGLAANNSATGSISINGTQVNLTNIYDSKAVVADINASQAVSGVFVRVNDNGQLEFESGSSFSLQLGNSNGFKTFAALGISVGLAASGTDLADTDSDDQLKDETINILSRIQLRSQNNSPIQIELTSNGGSATGLLEQNTSQSAASGSSLRDLNLLTADAAQSAIKVVDAALKNINEVRSNLGAVNNRLDFTISNLTNISEKMSAALSRIVDADFAQETTKLSRMQVLQQAATAMLAQANQRPQQILALLR
ncbi:MAG TPA: flagellinolysin [Cellvibrio sp.]|nr:flagellinolysin [Cellvibrio sp.]